MFEWKPIRNVILFVIGTGGFIALLLDWIMTGRHPDPSLLLACTGFAGLPVVLNKDENGNGK